MSCNRPLMSRQHPSPEAIPDAAATIARLFAEAHTVLATIKKPDAAVTARARRRAIQVLRRLPWSPPALPTLRAGCASLGLDVRIVPVQHAHR